LPRLDFPLSIHYRKGDLQCRIEGCTETVSVAGTEVVATTKGCPFRKLLVRWLLLGIGWLCVGLGAVGVVLPLLPTTPFLLLAAACFARASLRFYDWLLNTPVLGQYIEEYRAGLGIAGKNHRTVRPLHHHPQQRDMAGADVAGACVPVIDCRRGQRALARLPTRRRGHPNQ